jgi:hypothetical protein
MAIEHLDNTILHPQVFTYLTDFRMNGCTLRHIQSEVFKNLQFLQFLTFTLYNLKGFVHGNGIEWMKHLGSKNSILNANFLKRKSGSICDDACQNLIYNLVMVTFGEGTNFNNDFFPAAYFPNLFYNFPDADFCTFANFSFNKLIVFTWNQVLTENNTLLLSNCSCTMLWLFKNLALVWNISESYNAQIIMTNADGRICRTNNATLFVQAYNACNFPSRLQNCASIQTSLNEAAENNYNDQYFQLYDIQAFLNHANNFLSSGFNIGIAVFALVTNLATVAVIVNARRFQKAKGPVLKKDNELNSIDEQFFTYMLFNALINSLFSLSFLLSACISCAPKPINERYVNVTACVVANMSVAGVISLMKLMGNYTYVLMSMNRYLLVGKDHAKWIETVAKSDLKKTMCAAFIISCLLSLVSVYQVYYFGGFSMTANAGYESNSYYNSHSYLFGVSLDSKINAQVNLFNLRNAVSMLPLVFSLTVLHDLVSYFLFCFLNLALDVMTVLKLKESLAEKARLSSIKKRDEQMQAERRSVVMVVLNSIVNILLRLPELLAIVFYFAVAVNSNQIYPFKILCYDFNQCLTLGQISNSFVVLSLLFNVFFYYFFNKTFKFAFHLLFCGSRKKQPKK